MIRELMLGTALVGGGGYYVMSNYYSADIVRTIDASPHDAWRGFDVLMNRPAEDWTDFQPAHPEAHVSRPVVASVDSKSIDYSVSKDGQEAIRFNLRFDPAGDRKTRLRMNVWVSPTLVPEGSPITAANGALFKLMVGRVVDELIKQIESGKMVQAAEAFSEMRRQVRADPRFGEVKMRVEEYRRQEAQQAASKPMLDPDKAKLNPRGMDVTPDNPNPGY